MEINAIKFYHSPYDFLKQEPYQSKLVLRKDISHVDEKMLYSVDQHLKSRQGVMQEGKSRK